MSMYRYRITKRFDFSSSHRLADLPDAHPCSRLHGHNYRVELVLESTTLDEAGFVVDYNDLKPFIVEVKDWLDHQHLNDVLPPGVNPTAENLARLLYDEGHRRHRQLAAVRVSETEGTWAEYREIHVAI